MRTSADEKAIFAMHERTSGQERRASARRGSLTPVQGRKFATVRLRRPLLVASVDAGASVRFISVSTLFVARLAYASRSWLHRRKSSRMRGCALQRRLVSHGGLTSPALVSRCARLPTKKRFVRRTNAHPVRSGERQPAVAVVGRRLSVMCWKRACKRVCETTGGLRPPLLFRVRTSADEKAIFAMH
jgi:hypothetical protein